MQSRILRSLAHAALALGLTLPVAAALAHAERQSFFPASRVNAQPQYRPMLPTPQAQRLVVCKKSGNEGVATGEDSASRIDRIGNAALKSLNEKLYKECRYEHLQAAVDAVTTRGTTIYVLPGFYKEQPSVRSFESDFGASKPEDKAFCQAFVQSGRGKLNYEEQMRCRHLQNTVAIFGDPNPLDDDCGTDIEGQCTNPETQKCLTGPCQYLDLQIEGTGEKMSDVIFEGDFINKPGDAHDGGFRYLNGIRGDRADGLYLRNFTVQIYEFNAVYVLETDGYVFDRLLGRWVDEYAFLSFASDHGLYDYVEGYAAADSTHYPGSGADVAKDETHAKDYRARHATEIRNSKGHHAALGYSGTAGNAPYVHDNEFYKNQMGMATESIFGGHPGMPQDHGLWEFNKIYNNNKDFYRFVEADGPCIAKPARDRGLVPKEFREIDQLPPDAVEAVLDRTIVCPPIPFPTGQAMIIAGGNYNELRSNEVFDNWRRGFQLLSVPGVVRAPEEGSGPLAGVHIPGAPVQPSTLEALDPVNPWDTSHRNWYVDNHFGENKLGATPRIQPNGADFWWDNAGVANCWDGNTSASGGVSADRGDPIQNALPLPADCTDGPKPNTAEQLAAATSLARTASLLSCLEYSRTDPASKGSCDFFTPLTAPAGRDNHAAVTSKLPTQAQLQGAQTTRSGYFVLNNDTGLHHKLSKVTIQADGALSKLSGLTLTTEVLGLKGTTTHTVTLNQIGDSNVFSFSEPVDIEPVTYALFELQASSGNATAARRMDGAAMLALGSGGASLGLVFLGLGLRRRQLWLAAGLALVVSLLAGCHSSDSVGAGSGSKVSFTLSALEVSDDNGVVAYEGLAGGLPIGSVSVR